MFYSAFAAIVAALLLTLSDGVVISQNAADTTPSPFKFGRFPTPKKNIPNVTPAQTSAGSLETKWTIDFSSSEDANAVAVQADGKIVAAGAANVSLSSSPVDYDFAVFRYNADGSLDTSFDVDGKVTTPISTEFNNYDRAYAVAIQPDGKIIAGGTSLVRYNTDGSLDNSFGAGGIAVPMEVIWEIALQTDGKIVASSSYNGFRITRYNGDGSLDTSFGTGGIVTSTFDGNTWSAGSVDIQTDGKIVAAGYAGFCDEENCFLDFALARYNTNGSPDLSFDTDGKLTTDFGSSEGAYAVAIQADGKTVAVGWGYNDSGGYDFAAARYNENGSLDASFDGDGKVITNVGAYAYATSIALQSNGKIVVSGISSTNTGEDFALVRLNTDGSLDTSFDADGKLTTDFGGNRDFGADVALQADGKIVAAGRSGYYSNGFDAFDFALSRHNADGSLDAAFDGDGKLKTSFRGISSTVKAIVEGACVGYSNNGANDDFAIAGCGSGGKTITPIGNSDDRANSAAFDPSGRIIAAGYSHNGSNRDFALVRYYQNPAIDPFFGVNGKVTTDFSGNDEATAVAVQADRKILVVGQTSAGGGAPLVLARYNDNGSLDASFGTGGRVIVPAIQNAKAMAIQPDGKIIAAGNAPHTEFPFGDNFALARFNQDGTLDTSFDADGIAVTRFNFSSQINALALQPYGKIVAAGFTRNKFGTVFEFALARYNADGSLDTSFDADGKVTTSFGSSFNVANAVRVQRNGKIVAVGVSGSDSTFEDFALARYNGDGSLDATFDTDGKQTTDFFGSDDDASAVAIQRDGTIVAAGSAWRDGKTDFAGALYTGDAMRKVQYDYDDDGWADLSVFRPSNGVWYLNHSTQGFTATPWGVSTDRIAPADYDGDGKTDIAVYRDGTWYLRTSRTNSDRVVQFGSPGDIPVPADYIGDGGGRAELAIYRGGVWWTLNLTNNQISVDQFGVATDKPVPADYDGDGIIDQAVYRGSGEWHINGSSQGYTVIRFGLPNDKPLPADYDGDGKADLAVYRDGTWYLMQSTNGFSAIQWGLPSDIPAPADYDGDGKTDMAVFREGLWYLLQTSGGISIQQFGLPGDKPVPSAFVP